jgi:hypothetical protein
VLWKDGLGLQKTCMRLLGTAGLNIYSGYAMNKMR